MHSTSSNISNKSIWNRWFFTCKRWSLTPQFSSTWLLMQRQDGDVPAAWQQLTVILATKTRWWTPHNQHSPSLSLRQRKTMMDKFPKSSLWCCLLSALLGLTVASNAWLSSCLPSLGLAGLGLSSGSAAPFHDCFSHRHRGTHSAGIRKKHNKIVNFRSIFLFFLLLPLAAMMWAL